MALARNRLALALFVLCAPAAVLAPIAAWGDAPARAADAGAGGSGKTASGNRAGKKPTALTAGSRAFAQLVAQGNAKAAARDFDGAIDAYRKAVELAPHQALGHYLLGEAQVGAGNLDEAEASYNRAGLESSETDAAFHGRALFVLADLKERQKKWEDAKAAWQTYLDWTGRFPDAGGFPETARARLGVLDTAIKQNRAEDIVRTRIAASADGGVFSDPNKPPPPK